MRCTNRPGLLNALINAIEGSGFECIFTSVATYGDIARDVFYAVPTRSGGDAALIKAELVAVAG